MSQISKDFVNNVRELMAERGWNQSRLAREAGLTHAAISNYLNERSAPQMDALVRISGAFNCSIARLLMGPDDDVTVVIKKEKIMPGALDMAEQVRVWAKSHEALNRIPDDIRQEMLRLASDSPVWERVRKALKDKKN